MLQMDERQPNPVIDPNESDDAGRTALHLLVKACTTIQHFGQDDKVASRRDILQCIKLLVSVGARASNVTKQDRIWGGKLGCVDAHLHANFASIPPVSALGLAQSCGDMSFLRAVAGYVDTESVGANCEVCAEEFCLCCDRLEPPLERCGHRCCLDTIAGWFVAQGLEGATFDVLSCPVCLVPVQSASVVADCLRRANQQEALAMIERHSLEHSLSKIKGFVWCPRCSSGGIAHCQNAQCAECNYEFCVECSQNWSAHQGVTCEHLRKSGVGKSLDWIEQNTRNCPKCQTSIVHGGGCSHMACSLCKFEFCWLCMGPYNSNYTMDPNAILQRANKSKDPDSVKCPCGNVVQRQFVNKR